MQYIEIDKDDIPYRFDIRLKGETYTFQVNYNAYGDFFTLDLYKNDEVIILGEKLLYDKTLFRSVEYKDIPEVALKPYSKHDDIDRITYENMNDTVFLYVVGDENAMD